MLTIGLDTHSRSHSICILDENGKRLRRETVRGGMDAIVGRLAEIEDSFQVCFEASIDCGELHDRIARLPSAPAVVVVTPTQLRPTRTKNDRSDAERLAMLAFFRQARPVHIPAPATRHWRQLVETRCRVVQQRTKVKNGLKSLLRSRGIAAPPKLWSKEGLRWLRAVEMPDTCATLRRDLLIMQLRLFTRQIRTLGRELDGIARHDPRVELLRSTPGVGVRTAEAFVAWIDDPARFNRTRCVGAYFGLVPSQNQSGERNWLGSITKAGPKVVRWLLVEAAWRGVRKEGALRDSFQRLMHEDPQRRRKAIVATANRLARVMLTMLQENKPWDESRLGRNDRGVAAMR